MDTLILTALVGAGSAVLTTVPIAFLSYRLTVRKFEEDMMFERKVRTVLLEMLSSEQWEARSLEHIKKVFPGMDENQIRKALIEIGAVSVGRNRSGRELWSLLDRDGSRARMFMGAA